MTGLSRLSRNALTIAFLFLLDKLLAFVRAGVISRRFADQVHLLDAFNAANNLPDLLFALISGGALAMAFIPLLTEYLTTRNRAATWDLFSRVANMAFLTTAGLAGIVALFAEPIVDAEIGIAPGFGLEQRRLVADLMRLNLIGTVIFSISGLVMAGLQAHQHFVSPALAPILYNVGQIIGALAFAPRWSVHGLVYGVILGAALHLLVQAPALIRFGFRWTPAVDLRHSGLLAALKLIAPRLATMGGIQFIMLARDNLASRLDQVGAVTSLTYGWMIMQVPETLLGTAIATAMLPTLAELAARSDWDGFRGTIERALQVLIAFSLPIAAILAASLDPLVQVAFGFDVSTSTLLTWTTRAYLLTLTGYVIHEVAVRSFYARKEPLIPLAAVVIRLVIFLSIGIAGVALLRPWGAPIIALAEIALLIEAILLFAWLSARLHQPIRVDGALARGMVAALLGGAAAYGLARIAPFGQVLAALAGMSVGAGIVLPVVWREVRLLFRL